MRRLLRRITKNNLRDAVNTGTIKTVKMLNHKENQQISAFLVVAHKFKKIRDRNESILKDLFLSLFCNDPAGAISQRV